MTNDDALIVLCAVRYALGRRTYIVSTVCRYVKSKLKQFSDNDLYNIKRDIIEHGNYHAILNAPMNNNFEVIDFNNYNDNYGDKCDFDEWMLLLKDIENEIETRKTN